MKIDTLAQIIREVDGNHRLGAAALAEAILDHPRYCDIQLSLKSSGDCWLHLDAPSGNKASINLGQRGGANDQSLVGRVVREIAELRED